MRCSYLSAACWPGAEPLRFREALQGPGKVVFLDLKVYLVGVWSKTSKNPYNLKTSATSPLESAVMVLLSPTRYPAKASTVSHPAIPLASHLVSCYKN